MYGARVGVYVPMCCPGSALPLGREAVFSNKKTLALSPAAAHPVPAQTLCYGVPVLNR